MKTALGFLIAAQLLTTPAAMVDMVTYEEPENIVSYSEEKEPTRQEQFRWYYRMYEGRPQMRLWSITYARWVTDWIDC